MKDSSERQDENLATEQVDERRRNALSKLLKLGTVGSAASVALLTSTRKAAAS